MKVIQTELDGVFIIEPVVYADERGYFFESFRKSVIEDAVGKAIDFVQDNESLSEKNVIRGLHYQLAPYAQSKLVRVVRGAVLDVAVDIRRSSRSFGKYIAVELSSENKRQLFIPRGFAHGFLALEDDTIVAYKVDNYYSKEHDRGVRFDDVSIGIDWPIDSANALLSDKDRQLPFLKDAEVFE